jgi:hypothetical protein
VYTNKYGDLDLPEEKKKTAQDLREWHRMGKKKQLELIRELEAKRESQPFFPVLDEKMDNPPPLEDIPTQTRLKRRQTPADEQLDSSISNTTKRRSTESIDTTIDMDISMSAELPGPVQLDTRFNAAEADSSVAYPVAKFATPAHPIRLPPPPTCTGILLETLIGDGSGFKDKGVIRS